MSANNQINITPPRLLIVEDDTGLRELIINSLRREGFAATGVNSGGAAIAEIVAEPEQLLLLDQTLPDMTGREVIDVLSDRGIEPPFILITGHGDEQLAVEMMKLGAADYLIKDLNFIDILPGAVRRVCLNLDRERKLQAAEKALRESEARFLAMVAGIADVIAIVDENGINRYKSPNIERWFGWRPDEVVGASAFDLIHPDDLAQAQSVFAGILSQLQSSATGECRYRCKDGSYKWIEYTGSNLLSSPAIKGVLLNCHDITGRKHSEEVLTARLRLREMSRDRTVAEIHQATLDEAEGLTGSQIGFYHHFDEASNRLSLQAWSTQTATIFCRAEGHGQHYDLSQAGVWADCLRLRRPIIHNDFATVPNRKGMPTGHVEVRRELVVPVFRDNAIVAILGVGNKETPYTGQDVEAVSVLADLSWDIALGKQAEEELRAERNLSQRYLDTVEAIIVSLDQSGHITMINRKGSELLGYQAHELIGQNWFDCCIPDDGPYAYFLEIMAGRLPNAEYFENHILTRSGARRLIAWHNSYLRNDSGEMLGTLSAGEDITDRRRIEEELRASEQRYRSLYTKTPVMMHSINHAGEIISVSDYWLQTLGYAPEDLAGRKTTDFLTEESRRFATEVALPAFFRDGYCHEIPYRFVKKNGEVIDTLLSAIAERNENGAITRSLAVITDITERKRTEESLCLAKESAEAANRAKSEFLANMSHELRTPMNGVLGMLQLLGMTPLSKEQSEYVRLAADAGRGLVELVNDLLDLARIEVGQVELELRATNPRELLGNTCKFFMPMAAKKGLLLTEQLDDQLPACLKLDSARLRQILFNLLGNAIKFTARGEVSCQAQLLDAAGQKQLEIVIADSGIGIAPENLSRIFEPFVQVEGTYQRSFQGAGLGLSIVKRLVSLMHGEVSLESRLGVGTTVRVTIPVTEMVAATPQPVTTVARPGTSNQACILLAEDNAINRMTMQCYLEKIGYRVLGAVNGREALELLHTHDVDLVLMDIQMPVMDGMEAFRLIRSGTGKVRNPQVPVVALTAFAMESDRQAFLSAGMNACLTKPVDFDELLKTVARFCAKD